MVCQEFLKKQIRWFSSVPLVTVWGQQSDSNSINGKGHRTEQGVALSYLEQEPYSSLGSDALDYFLETQKCSCIFSQKSNYLLPRRDASLLWGFEAVNGDLLLIPLQL
jgi:hypothetical protein